MAQKYDPRKLFPFVEDLENPGIRNPEARSRFPEGMVSFGNHRIGVFRTRKVKFLPENSLPGVTKASLKALQVLFRPVLLAIWKEILK